MKIQEIKDLNSLIWEKTNDDPETAFDFFKEKWKKLTFDDKRLLYRCINTPLPGEPIGDYSAYLEAKNKRPTQNERDKSYLITICSSLITDYIINELNNQPNFRQFLRCGESIGPSEIACVFMLLKDLKYLDNTFEEIEEVIAPLFNLNQNTIHSYFKDPGKLKIAARKFKQKINESSLVNRKH